MEASSTIKSMLAGNKIFVPTYQRAYSWDTEFETSKTPKQVNVFLTDLQDYNKSTTKNQTVTVKNGGDAMAAYRDMMYGISKDMPIAKQAYNEALKQYCKLDTLAMVIIWEHWQNLLKSGNRVTSRENIIANLKN